MKINPTTLIAAIFFLVLIVGGAKAQEQEQGAFGYDELMAECSIILDPTICERFKAAGEKSFEIFEHAMTLLFTEGLDEANRELDRMLDDIERGFPLTKKKGTWI